MKPKRQTKKKQQEKVSSDNRKSFDGQNQHFTEKIASLRESSIENQEKTIENFLKEEIHISLRNIISYVLNSFGVDNLGLLDEKEFLLERKGEAIKTLLQKENAIVEVDSKVAIDNALFFFRTFFRYFSVVLRPQKRSPLKNPWLAMLDEILSWLSQISDVGRDSFRVEFVVFVCQILYDILDVQLLFEDINFCQIFENFVFQFLTKRLSDRYNAVKLELLIFMDRTKDKTDYLFEGKGRVSKDLPSLLTLLINDFRGDDSKLKLQNIRILSTYLESKVVNTRTMTGEAIKHSKNTILQATISATVRELDHFITFIKLLYKKYELLDREDMISYYLLMNVSNKAINQKGTLLFLDCLDAKSGISEEFREEKFVEVMGEVGNIVNANKRLDGIYNFESVVSNFTEFLDISKTKRDILQFVLDLVGKKDVELRNQNLFNNIIKFLTIYAKHAIDKKEPFLEEDISDNFSALIEGCDKRSCLVSFLKLYRLQALVEDSIEYEQKVKRLNHLITTSTNSEVIHEIFQFFHANRNRSRAILTILHQDYDTLKQQLELYDLKYNPDDTTRILLLKIKEITRTFLLDRDIALDFPKVDNILTNYTNDRSDFAPVEIIKYCLSFKLIAFKGIYLRFFKNTGSVETAKQVLDAARSSTIELLQMFMEYSSSKFNLMHTDKIQIRLCAFNFLLDLYKLISNDSLSSLVGVYYQPNNENLNCIVNFINDNLENLNKHIVENTTFDKIDGKKNQRDDTHLFDNSKRSELKDSVLIQDEDSATSVSICLDILKFLPKCNKSFGRRIGHEIIAIYLGFKKTGDYFLTPINNFLQEMITTDTEDMESTNFWNYFFRLMHNNGTTYDLLNDAAKIFIKIFNGIYYTRQVSDSARHKLQRHYIAVVAKMINDGLGKPEHAFFLTIASNHFINKRFFRTQNDKLKAILGRLMEFKSNVKLRDETKLIYSHLNVLESRIMKTLDSNRKEFEEGAKKDEVKLETDNDNQYLKKEENRDDEDK